MKVLRLKFKPVIAVANGKGAESKVLLRNRTAEKAKLRHQNQAEEG